MVEATGGAMVEVMVVVVTVEVMVAERVVKICYRSDPLLWAMVEVTVAAMVEVIVVVVTVEVMVAERVVEICYRSDMYACCFERW
jgi:hypothetical protein